MNSLSLSLSHKTFMFLSFKNNNTFLLNSLYYYARKCLLLFILVTESFVHITSKRPDKNPHSLLFQVWGECCPTRWRNGEGLVPVGHPVLHRCHQFLPASQCRAIAAWARYCAYLSAPQVSLATTTSKSAHGAIFFYYVIMKNFNRRDSTVLR